MPIARVMNMPDGSTPTPPVGGGDVNGTLAIQFGAHAGTPANALGVPTHLHFQCSKAGIPSVAVPMADEGEGQPVAIEEGGVADEGIEAPAPTPPPRRSPAPASSRRM